MLELISCFEMRMKRKMEFQQCPTLQSPEVLEKPQFTMRELLQAPVEGSRQDR